jgi:D-3-phosphoglycerate dehydrogenase
LISQTKDKEETMAKYKVVVTDRVFPNLDPEKKVLEPLGVEILGGQCQSLDEIISLSKDASAILNCYFKPIGEEIFQACSRLKAVVRYGIGVDTIDIPAATRHGIMVANVPDYCQEEVADHTTSLLLALARKIVLANKRVKHGEWDLSCLKPMARLRGMTVGFAGFGRIARLVGNRLTTFGVNLIFYDPYVQENVVDKANKVTLEELLKQSDFLLIHTPETEETRHLLNRERFALMKQTACIINTARGGIIETSALIESLQSGRLAGAALDVIEGIPPITPDHPLCQMDNVILTPHSAFYSEDSMIDLQVKAAQEVARVLSGERPLSLLNPEVLKR